MKKSKNNSEREPSTPILDMLIQLQGGWTPGSKTNIYDTRGVYDGDPVWCHTWDIAGKIYRPDDILPIDEMSDKQLLAELQYATQDARRGLAHPGLDEVALALLDKVAGAPNWQQGIKNFLKRMRTTFVYSGWQSQQFPDDGYGVKPPSTAKSCGKWRI